MMTVTAVEKVKGSRYRVDIDGAYWYILDIELIVANGIRVGAVCDETFLDDVKAQAERRKAKERALYLLELRDHTRKELIDKLKKSVAPEIAEETADKMEEYGFLDDRRYASRYAVVLLTQKKLGRRAALYQMQQKGIERLLAEEALDEVDADPLDQLRELIDRRYARYLTDEKGAQKVTNALARLGHSYSDIREVLREYEMDWDR